MFARLEAAGAPTNCATTASRREQIRIQRALDMRYAGQGYEITMPCGDEPLRDGGLDALRKQFDEQHKAMFGHSAPEEPVEIVSYRVRGVGLVPPVEMPQFKPTGATLKDALRETRRVRMDGKDIDCPVYQREKLDVGLTLDGTGDPRSVRLHDRDLCRPDRAGGRVQEFDRDVRQ